MLLGLLTLGLRHLKCSYILADAKDADDIALGVAARSDIYQNLDAGAILGGDAFQLTPHGS